MSYHYRSLKFFSSKLGDWNFNKLLIEDVDPYTGKKFNSGANIYNGMKYSNELLIKELLKYISISDDLNEYINKTAFNGPKTQYYKAFKMLKYLFICVAENYNRTLSKKQYNHYLRTKDFFINIDNDENQLKISADKTHSKYNRMFNDLNMSPEIRSRLNIILDYIISEMYVSE